MSALVLAPRRLFFAALVAWAAIVAIGLAMHSPLHGDEASYAVLARGDATGWVYRSRGVVALAHVGLWLGGGDVAMRLASAVLGLGVVLGAAAAGRAVGGPHAGAWSAAVIAGAHPCVLRGAELLGDLPATAALLGAIALALGELSRDDGPRYRLVAAAPLLAAALYLRYGSVLVIGVIAAATIAVWWRAIARRPGPVVATAAAFAVLVVPFVVLSIHETGSPIGVLDASAAVIEPVRRYPGSGLVAYLTRDPFELYGILVAPLAVIGIVRARTRAHAYFVAIALGEIVALGLTTHAEGRYVLVASTLLAVLGVTAILEHLGRAALALVAASWLSCAVMIGVSQHRVPVAERVRGAAIRADDAGRPCVVFARAIPQLMWYAGCEGRLIKPDGAPEHVPASRAWYAADATDYPALDLAALVHALDAHPVQLVPGAWRIER